jgi:peroxiredoxin
VELQQNYDKIQSAGAELFAISSENVALTQRTTENHGLTYPVLSDNKKEMIIAYNVLDPYDTGKARPAAYIITPDGKVAWKSLDTAAARVPTATILTELGKL